MMCIALCNGSSSQIFSASSIVGTSIMSSPADADPESLARIITSVMHSLAGRARAGGSRNELSKLAQNFLNLLIPDAAKTSVLK